MRSMWKAAVQNPTLILVCLLGIALGFSLAANLYCHSGASVVAAPAKDLTQSNWRTAFEDIAEKLAPSVVFITSETDVKYQRVDPFQGFDDFFNGWPFGGPGGPSRRSQPQTQIVPQMAAGTGFIVRSDGYIVTNNHVVAGADKVTVKLQDGRKFDGKVTVDPTTDLAVIKIKATGLTPVTFADSDKVKVGEWSVAIGNPFELSNTVTVGVVSAMRRAGDAGFDVGYPEAIQTDAAINPGNSGGPLVDLDGKVIGVNFAIISPTHQSAGIGFAIPSNTVKDIVDKLISNGKVVRGYLGIHPIDLTPEKSKVYGVTKGALVGEVTPGEAADKAGVKVTDVITKIDGKPVDSALQLRHTIQNLTPGSTVKLTIMRDKVEKTISVKLAEAPGNAAGSTSPAAESGKLGLSAQTLTAGVAKQLGFTSTITGVLVKSVAGGGAAQRAGIQENDVIMKINTTATPDVAAYNSAIKELKSGDTAIVVVARVETSPDGNSRQESSSIVEVPID